MMQMARSLFLLHPVRSSLTQLTSPPPSLLLASRNPLNLKSLLLSTLPKHFEPRIFKHGSSCRWKLFAQGLHFSNLSKSGNYSSMKRICGLSITFGSVYLWPKMASAMDGFEVSVDADYDDRMNYLSASEAEEKYRDVLLLVRKLLLPIFMVLTVVTNWGQPILLVTRVMLTLITTKPSPFSVYLFIEELRYQHMKQQPFMFKFKSIYAKQIEIEDYALLCVAKVELNEESLTLIGILGSWWVLPSLQIEEAFVAVKKRLSDTYSSRYFKDST